MVVAGSVPKAAVNSRCTPTASGQAQGTPDTLTPISANSLWGMKYRHVLDRLSPTLQLQLVTGGIGTSQVLQRLPRVPLLTDLQAFLPAQCVFSCANCLAQILQGHRLQNLLGYGMHFDVFSIKLQLTIVPAIA